MKFLLAEAWLALGLALPVLVFYLIRQRARARPVSTLLFWEQVKPQVHNRPLWRRFRQWFSYLLQVLFLLLLAAALARPYFFWQSEEETAYVFVLDPSASMGAVDGGRDGGGTSAWEEAVAAARRRVNQMLHTDRAAVVLAGDPPRVLQGWTGSRRLLHEALDGARPGKRDVAVGPALRLAVNLASQRPRRRVVLFTDGVWPRRPGADLLAGVEVARVGGARRNLGLTQFAARRSLAVPGEYTLQVRVDYSGEEPFTGNVVFKRDGQLTDAHKLQLEPGGHWEHAWTERRESATRYAVELDPPPGDALAADDRAELTLRPLAGVQVYLVSEPNGFLQAAFLALQGVTVTPVKPGDLLPEPAPPPGDDGAAGAGGPAPSCWVFYRTAPPEGFERGPGSAVILIDPPGGGFWGELEEGGGEDAAENPLVTDWERGSDLLRYVQMDSVNLRRAARFSPPPGATAYVRSFDLPLVYGNWERPPRWIVFAFDLERSDFALRVAFPVLMGNLVQALRSGSDPVSAELPGAGETRLQPAGDGGENGIGGGIPSGEAPGWLARVASFPLWWWCVALAALWCLLEWFCFTRRITE